MNRRTHWEQVYETRSTDEMSWYQSQPTLSLDLIEATGAKHGTRYQVPSARTTTAATEHSRNRRDFPLLR